MTRTLDKELRDGVKDLRENAKALRRDVRNLAGAIGDEAVSQFDDLAATAGAQAKVAYKDVRARVSHNPAIALGVAAGAGVILGFLMRGSR